MMEPINLIRMCHCCGTLNESENDDILKCANERCSKNFLPIDYFKKVRERAIKAGEVSKELPAFPRNPLYGLLVFW